MDDPQLFLSKTGFRRVTATSVPVSGITGLGSGVATWLASPSSAHLLSAMTDKTGTGLLVFGTSPTLSGIPLAPTATGGTNTTQIATTAFVQSAISGLGTGTVTSVSVVTANGVSGSVANPTTTPAITLTLGAITPSSVVATGNITGLNLSGTNTGDQTNISGNAATVTTNANLTGPITSVGNAVSSLTAFNVLLGNGAGAIAYAPPVSAGYVLTDNGVGSNPTFQASASGATSINGLSDAYYVSNNMDLGQKLAFATGSSFNFFAGFGTGSVGTSSMTRNTGVGTNTLNGLTSGTHNTAVGMNAVTGATGTSDLTGIGYRALYQADANNNTGVGSTAGFTLTSGDKNTFLGATADTTLNSISNSMALGYGASVSTSNTVQIGNASVTDVYLGTGLAKLHASNGGSTTSSNGSTLVLTSSSNKMQMVTMTTSGLSVQLPDATTLTAGGVIFMIKNTGSYQFSIIDNAGNPRCLLAAGESVMMWCSDISTATGVWASGETSGWVSDLFGVNSSSSTTVTGAGASGALRTCITYLTSTTAFVCYYDQTVTASVFGVVITITGESISVGTAVTLSTGSASFSHACCTLDATHVLVAYSLTATSFIQVVSISGTTVTAHTQVSVESAKIQNIHLFPITSTSAYLAYSQATGTKNAGVVVTTSGTTPTVNSITYGAATVNSVVGALTVCQLSTTAYFYGYAGTTGYLAAQIFTVSSTTVTANSGITNQSNSVAQQDMRCANFGSNMVVLVSNITPSGTFNFNMFTFTISGTTISLASPAIAVGPSTTSAAPGYAIGVTPINNSSGVVTLINVIQGAYRIQQLPFKLDPISGDIMPEPFLTLGITNVGAKADSFYLGGYPCVAQATTSSGKYLVGYTDTTSSGKPAVAYMNVIY